MRYAVLGTGTVGRTIAGKLVELGHEVMMGSRSGRNEKGVAWKAAHGERAFCGTFRDAAAFGERIFISVKGIHTLEALTAAGKENFRGKLVIDQSNPYQYKEGHISLDPAYSGDTSLGEAVQDFLPDARVVKTLNFIGADMMTKPASLAEEVTGFYCGNDGQAKKEAEQILQGFGWQDTFDLGDISMARYTEMLGAFWVPVFGRLGHMKWGLRLVR